MNNETAPVDPQWAWAPYSPSSERPWDLKWAGHLYRRAAFGASWDQLQKALKEGPDQTLAWLLDPNGNRSEFETAFDEYESSAAYSSSTEGLRAWWLRRMLQTPNPLQEKMTLFWHNHFAVNQAKVKSGRLTLQRLRLTRKYAQGNYAKLLEEIVHHPSTLIALNAEKNRKTLPNEHFSRMIMENYCLGPDLCSEEDIRDVARAFTGWFLIRNELRFLEREHDDADKRILGEEGNFNSADVVKLVLRHKAAAWLIVKKLYRNFISEIDNPADSLLEPLVNQFREHYDIKQLVRVMLKSNLFFSDAAYRKCVKCPASFALEIAKGFEANISTTCLGRDLAALGQDLFHPSTIKGWPSGRHWINSATLAGRCNLVHALVTGAGSYENQLSPSSLFSKYNCKTKTEASQLILNIFLQNDLEPSVQKQIFQQNPNLDAQSWLKHYIINVLSLPEFQLA